MHLSFYNITQLPLLPTCKGRKKGAWLKEREREREEERERGEREREEKEDSRQRQRQSGKGKKRHKDTTLWFLGNCFPSRQGSDRSLLSKMNHNHGRNKNYIEPRSNEDQSFGLNHFAGVVTYDVKDFLEKNRDSFNADLKQLIYISSNKFLKNLFADDLAQAEDSKKRNLSLSFQFRKSLELLMKTLGSCHPFFVRCIKPNHFKKPKVFDRNLCCRQLRYSGMMETAKIRRAGFPIRHNFKEFVYRYRMLVPGIPHASKTDCTEASAKICDAVLGSGGAETYQLGKTKVFLKDAHDTILEQKREQVLAKSILILQRSIKTWVYRRRFLRLKKAAIVIQKYWRGRKPRQHFLCIRKGYLRLQVLIRSRVLRSAYLQSQAYIVKFQFKMKRLQELMILRKQEEAQLKKMGNKNYKAIAEENYKKRLVELQKEVQDSELGADVESLEDDDYVQLVDDIFGDIIEKSSPSTPQTPTKIITDVFGDLGAARQHSEEIIPMPQFPAPDRKDLSEFNFRKFAMTYFRGNINFQYSRRPIRHSLLELSHPGDQLLEDESLWPQGPWLYPEHGEMINSTHQSLFNPPYLNLLGTENCRQGNTSYQHQLHTKGV
ncbi:hypothetical protein PR048_021507 [Dryococelus australis]|uniref:Myosin motor domain-containing protein n=1 Tax=Dryococelus australis TaxID=614101 RepID=A0ABQ9GYF7_9NEOP|nr:hypothetical protein PR048_021507 [Dryococelus australis]